jgi:hypothetical protein
MPSAPANFGVHRVVARKPVARARPLVDLDGALGAHQHEHQRVLGHRLRVRAGRVHHRDAETRRRRDVDDVEAGAVAPHHPELLARGHERLGAQRLPAEQDALRVFGQREHVGVGEVFRDHHAGSALEQGLTVGVNFSAEHYERARVVGHGSG